MTLGKVKARANKTFILQVSLRMVTKDCQFFYSTGHRLFSSKKEHFRMQEKIVHTNETA
jgi:hypothetical protein